MKRLNRKKNNTSRITRGGSPKSQPSNKIGVKSATANLSTGSLLLSNPSALISSITDAELALKAENPHEAFEICCSILKNETDNVNALNLAGVAAFKMGLVDEAQDLLKTAIFYSPDHAKALNNLGNVCSHCGQIEEAIEAYEEAIEIDVNYIEAYFNFGVLLQKDGRYFDAIKVLEKAVALDSRHSLAWHTLGNAYRSCSRYNMAKHAFECAIESGPDRAQSYTNLGAVLHELGDFDSSIKNSQKALKLEPNEIVAQYNLAISLQELNLFDEANELYSRVLAANPSNAAAAMNKGFGLQQLGKLDEALKLFKLAVKVDPNFAQAHVNLADLYLQMGEIKTANFVCGDFLNRHPANPDLLAFNAILLKERGETLLSEKLLNYDKFLKTHFISAPAGYKDMDEFNLSLKNHILRHPTLTRAPQSHATRKGSHSGNLLEEPKGPFKALEQLLFIYAEDYKAQFVNEKNHPFFLNPPKLMGLSIWGVIIERMGYQLPHIHPSAWLSGVYYAEVPKSSSSKDEENAGWIAFGRPPKHFHNNVNFVPKLIEPKNGMVLLFPSFFYHHTIPTKKNSKRVSIAFDFCNLE